MMKIALQKNLKKLRLQYNYKQEYVAACLGVSQATYCRIERGEMSSVSIQTIEKLAGIYNVSPNKLLDDIGGGKYSLIKPL